VRYITKVMGTLLRFLHPQTKLFAVSSGAFWKFSPHEVYEESSWRNVMIFASKTELFAVKFRRILKVFCLQCSQKNFWAHFHDYMIHQKWLMKRFSVKKNLQRAPKFVLILTALFRHQPTYKNLRGNTGPCTACYLTCALCV